MEKKTCNATMNCTCTIWGTEYCAEHCPLRYQEDDREDVGEREEDLPETA